MDACFTVTARDWGQTNAREGKSEKGTLGSGVQSLDAALMTEGQQQEGQEERGRSQHKQQDTNTPQNVRHKPRTAESKGMGRMDGVSIFAW